MTEVITPNLARWLRISARIWLVVATIWLLAQTIEAVNRAVYYSRKTSDETIVRAMNKKAATDTTATKETDVFDDVAQTATDSNQ